MKAKNLLYLIFLTLLTPVLKAQTWQTMGGNDVNQASFGSAGYTSIATFGGNIYYAYQDGSLAKATVRKFNGTAWATVGTAGFSGGTMGSGGAKLSMALDATGNPYVAYRDPGTSKVTVMKFNGTSWVAVGATSFSTIVSNAATSYVSIAVFSASAIYVVYTDNSTNKATVYKYNGTSWAILGTAFSTAGATYTSIALDNTGIPYVAYSDASTSVTNKITVMKWNGSTAWVLVGTQGFSTKAATYTSITITGTTPYVVFSDANTSVANKATVMKFTAGAWALVGTAGFSSNVASYTTITLDASGNPYVAYRDQGSASRASVMKFNGTTWALVGSAGFTTGIAFYTSIAMNGSNPCIVCQDGGLGSRANVLQFNGTSWVNPAPIDPGIFANTSVNQMALDNNGTPYITCADGNNSTKTTVKKWNGASWQVVGAAGFSQGNDVYGDRIAFDNNNNPWVVLGETGCGNSCTVYKFDGTTWNMIGLCGFYTAGAATGDCLAFDNNGTPYIAFADGSLLNATTVMKYDGSNWVVVGAAGFYGGGGSMTFAIDHNNTPYVFVNSTVLKYDGTNWVIVGAENFAPGSAFVGELAFDKNNTPYVAFEDGSLSSPNDRASVMKFDGTNWVFVGGEGFSSQSAKNFSITCDATGAPYIFFSDYANSQRGTVMKYDGSNWVTVGSGGFTAGIPNSTSVAVDANGNVYACYGATGAGVTGALWAFEYTPALNSITTGTVTGPLCKGSNLNVTYTNIGTAAIGNTFTAQLSDASGSFSSPTNIGTLSSTIGGTIACTIPNTGITSGTQYRIRVVSSNPMVTGADNGSDISISFPSLVSPGTINNTCPSIIADITSLLVADNNSTIGTLTYYNNLTDATNAANAISGTGLGNGTYYIRKTTAGGCFDVTSVTVSIISCCTNVSVSSAVAGASPICSSATTSLTANGVAGTNAVVHWWGASGGTGTDYGTTLISGGTSTLANKGPGTYFARVTGDCGSPVEASVTVGALSTPSAPVAISGTNVGLTSFTARWNSSGGATGYFLDVSTDNAFGSFVSGYSNLSVGGTSQSVTGLSSGITYYYRVRASNASCTSGNSNTISVSTNGCPPVISGGTVTPINSVICSGGTELLTVAGAAGGTNQWQVSTDNIHWSDIVGATTASYLASATQKTYYRSQTISVLCYNVSSNVATIDISATPVITIANVTSTTVTITWSPYGSGQYDISWSGAAGTGSAPAVTTNTFTISGLISNADLLVTVTPNAPSCGGVNAASAGTHTLCATPTVTNVSATGIIHGFKVNWTTVSGATAYRVYYRDLGSSSTWSFVDTTGTRKSINVPYGGHTYAVYVRAKDCPSAGNLGDASTPTNYVTTNPLPGCSPAPTVTSSSSCPNQIHVDISGTPPPYNLILRRISPSITAGVSYPVSTTSVNITVGTQYAGSTWEIFATKNCGAGGISVISNVSLVTLKPGCPQLTNVVVSHPTCNGFSVSWNGDDCAGLGISGYQLLIKKTGSSSYNGYSVGTATHDVVNWLPSDNTWNVVVMSVACNGAASAASNPDTIATLHCGREGGNPEETITTPTGNDKETVTVYPNPTQGQFWVNLSTANAETMVKIELINQLGEVVETNLSQSTGGQLSQVINTPEGLASGIYFVRTSVAGNVYVNRIMISKE